MNFILSEILKNTLVDFNLSSTLRARDARLAGLDRARFAIIAKNPTCWTAASSGNAEMATAAIIPVIARCCCLQEDS
jgi:hypothetical protein